MSDVAKAAQAASHLIEKLDAELEDGESIGEILMICEVITAEDKASYMQWHCTSERFLIQVGLVSWAHAALTSPSHRTVDNDEEDEDSDG